MFYYLQINIETFLLACFMDGDFQGLLTSWSLRMSPQNNTDLILSQFLWVFLGVSLSVLPTISIIFHTLIAFDLNDHNVCKIFILYAF